MAYTTIDNPGLYFNSILWTGDGASTRSITGVGFQPDWIWVKCRSTGHDHYSWDSVRTNKKGLEPSDTAEERTPTLGSIDSDGFSFASLDSFYNANSDTYVSWNWKTGTSFSNDASATGVGDIDSSGSINTTAGFSIIGYNGNNTSSAGIAHGLGATPSMIIQKRRADSVASWRVWHNKIHATSGETKTLLLNTTAANASDNDNISGVSSTTFTVRGAGGATNPNGSTCIAYCFAEKKGYSKFGSYTGGGDPFIYLGFKPAWIMFKNAGATENWRIVDNKRDTDNPVVQHLFANSSGTEASGTSYSDFIDFLSNGFKIRSGSGEVDGSGNTIMYMAFAEAPFVTEGTKAAGTAR